MKTLAAIVLLTAYSLTQQSAYYSARAGDHSALAYRDCSIMVVAC